MLLILWIGLMISFYISIYTKFLSAESNDSESEDEENRRNRGNGGNEEGDAPIQPH